MGKCAIHPDRETSFMCMKHGVYMCEECLRCRDPEIYCKFRSACPIWFMYKNKEERDKKEVRSFKVTFKPDDKTVEVLEGTSLLEAAQAAEVPLNASCNGNGSCGKCRLILISGDVESIPSPLLSEKDKEKKYVLACQTSIKNDIAVKIPEETLEKRLKVVGMGQDATKKLMGLVREPDPMLRRISLELSPPTLEDPVSDLDRLKRGLKKSGYDRGRLNADLKVMRDLAHAMRDDNWKVTASVIRKDCADEVVGVVSGDVEEKSYGLAVDIGTTSIVVYLVDMADGTIIAATSGHNRQAACGDDVINRIICVEKDGAKKLSGMVLSTINGLINEATGSNDVDYRQIDNVVISGNTTMIHLLLKIEPRYIRREPYIPGASEFPILKAGNIGLKVNPVAAVFVMPGPASYVGGDIVSGLLYTGLHRKEPLTLFIDVGTNGEIVLGNKDWLMTASCSAGPAFEGGGVRWGMRAEEGAIEKLSIDRKTLEPVVSIVGDVSARGICGSGMIDLISEMLLSGIIDPAGKFRLDLNHPGMKTDEYGPVYIVVKANNTSMEEDIVFSEQDIKNIVLSKAAVYAGFSVLLNHAGLDFSMVDRVMITGGFGQYLNIDKAITIGLLPDIDRTKFTYHGNSSIAGAYMALMSKEIRDEAEKISRSMTYIDFSSNVRFMDEFTSAQFLPHTNMSEFPSVESKLEVPINYY